MKILLINKFYYLRGGSERYVFDLSKLLEDNGHQVVQFSMTDDKNYYSKFSKYFIKQVDLDKFNVINIIKFFYNYEAVRQLKALIKMEKPEIAHLHNIAHQLSPAIISVLKKNNIPVVQTLHDYKLICPNSKLFSQGKICEKCRGGRYYHSLSEKCFKDSWAKSFLGMLEAYLNNRILNIYNKIDMFIAPSRFMKDICVKFGLPSDKIEVIYNFIDAEDNFPKKMESSSNYLLYFGRLSPEKGVTVLLDAMAKIKVGVDLKIAGTGPDHNKLKEITKKLGIADRVKFLGPRYGNDLQTLLQNSSAVIVPSIWPENMPYGVLEALALGKIVIASRIGGLGEIIQDGVNGVLFKSGDSDELAQKISQIMANSQGMIKIMEAKAKSSISEFNKQKHYEKINKIYKKSLRLANII